MCKEKNILFIEDNAIYFGNYANIDQKKLMAGSFGDVSLFSFGIMKNISAFFGGALATSNKDLRDFADTKIKSYKNFPKLLYLKQILLYVMLKILLSKYVYNYFFFYVIKFALKRY